jgi:serine/threonine protein kinase
MKIEYLSSDGIQASEKAALERMRQAFNASKFSMKWHGYAAFMMIDTRYRDREIDLILLTHDRLLIVELKKWNGRITTAGDHWFLNGSDMGRSAVKVLADKWKILSSKISDRLKDPARSVWIDYRVILCGSADASGIPLDERRFVLSLDYFLKLSTRGEYEKEFGKPHPKAVNAADEAATFAQFFRGSQQFKATVFSYMNFQIDGDVIFPHPDGLYKEYRAVKKDDARIQALLRRWDFSVLEGKADTLDERARIALREHQVLGYVHEQDEDLDTVLLQPLSHPTRDDVDADFCELYKLPSRQSRLSEFVNRFRDELNPSERLALVKILLAHFADLHDIRVAHRDIGDHSVWLERPSKVSISGLITAYYPEATTVGGIREAVRAGKMAIPEDTPGVGHGAQSDGFRRDVYLLGVVCYYLLYLQWPPKETGVDVHFWRAVDPDPFGINISDWLKKALELLPADRFSNAREMLNALNAIRSDTDSKSGLDMRAFEPYRTDVLPTVVYRLEENIRQGHCHVYKSSISGQCVVVKIWYRLRPDPKRIEEGLGLLSFLEKARLVKGQRSDLVPEIVDFGISDAGTYLVQKCVQGRPLSEVLPEKRSAKETLQLCRTLLYATEHLHGLGFVHGDISPDNVFSDDGLIRFVDVVDVFGNGTQPCSPAYAPPDYDSVPLVERDCFGVAKICEQLLQSHVADRSYDLSRIFDEIGNCLTHASSVYRIDLITEAVEELINIKPVTKSPMLTVHLRRAPAPSKMASDNGSYYVGVFPDRRRPELIDIAVSGVRSQLLISIDPQTHSVKWLRFKEIQHSQFVIAATRAITKLEAEIHIAPTNIDGAHELVEKLLSIPSIFEAVEELVGIRAPQTQEAKAPSTVAVPQTEDIWNALIEAEESTLPEAEVSGPAIWDITTSNRLQIPYSKIGEPLDYDPEDEIEVLREFNGDWVRVGYLNTRETGVTVLVVDGAHFRGKVEIGEKLKFRSMQDLSSFRRRQSAVSRIVAEEAVIPNLLSYFDPASCPEPTQFAAEPLPAELDAYTVKENGNVTFSLNEQQRQAFTRLWVNGPVGLLQGPPGTGKTAFIASFIHYSLSKGAQNILLASQSHEAVNNAAEKVIELCNRTRVPVDLVRFGAEGMVSEPLRPYHSSAILEAYRELFRSEIRSRVTSLGSNLGLPQDFVQSWFDVEFYLGRLAREVAKLEEKISGMPEGSSGRDNLIAKVSRRTDRIDILVRERFATNRRGTVIETVDAIRKELAEQFEIRSLDATRRLDQIIGVAREWVERLGTQGGKFEEFLAKTRTLVCGTCVGLGRVHFGITKNRYDWVIVDEAARATPSELAVAIQAGRRVLLVGDHRQLPPLYTQEVVDNICMRLGCADKAILTRSDFERAFESSYGQKVGATLQIQYRMAPAIGELVSACFYPSPLLPGRGDPEGWFSLLPPFAQAVVTWIDTSDVGPESYEKRKKGNPSRENPFEAREVINLIRQITSRTDFISELMTRSNEDDKPIGIICTYAEQKRLVQKLLSEQDWATGVRHLIKVDTVDSYQGKENRIIVLSLTRNNPALDEGYLISPERTNVAMSRAMDRLFIVGAARMWRETNRNSPLGRVYSFIESRVDGKNFQIVHAPVGVGLES